MTVKSGTLCNLRQVRFSVLEIACALYGRCLPASICTQATKHTWEGIGQFDERVFIGLDFLIAEAGKRGLKLILALTNYWSPFGGMAQYVK